MGVSRDFGRGVGDSLVAGEVTVDAQRRRCKPNQHPEKWNQVFYLVSANGSAPVSALVSQMFLIAPAGQGLASCNRAGQPKKT